MPTRLSPAQLRHLQRYAAGEEGFKNSRSEKRLVDLGFLERCDETIRYNAVVSWTIYKARITDAGRRFLDQFA
jgi:hypothetical protein